jgi:hypothetical protein
MIEALEGEIKRLADFMSDLSEEAYSAAWMDGLEYALWYAVENGRMTYGRLDINDSQILALKDLSDSVGGWVYFDDEVEESYIAIERWTQMYNENIQSYDRKIS